jgi:hypothetical protein
MPKYPLNNSTDILEVGCVVIQFWNCGYSNGAGILCVCIGCRRNIVVKLDVGKWCKYLFIDVKIVSLTDAVIQDVYNETP